jgi:flavin reductase (DIM6/NTAB) family NADH-FMN oxidoreductase RutF
VSADATIEGRDWHSYEPSKSHGLRHDPLTSIIGPRPIGWISTIGATGIHNLAPYSFFNLFNYQPPIVGFASIGAKDTLRNVQQTGEFVWNLATRDLAGPMAETSTPVSDDTSEFELAGLTPLASRIVAPPRVAESAVQFECRLTDVHQLRARDGTMLATWLVLGEVVAVHIRQDRLVDGAFDTFGSGIILRAGGPDYALVLPESRFAVGRSSLSLLKMSGLVKKAIAGFRK